MLKRMLEHVDDLRSKSNQCENQIELELKYVYLKRSVEHIITSEWRIINGGPVYVNET